ncbi:MAG: hypothetical protein HLUCCO02_00810 [Idiomarinaceae bacterium HL-53]|nr:MAG: hypothetical protein HLUCCO02_00810 [Idiomarinaceae bacterium HL-53]CUS48574.1 hypothetical protein Ga0003345_1533 [Idiomarinaceae bacterium HL-53]
MPAMSLAFRKGAFQLSLGVNALLFVTTLILALVYGGLTVALLVGVPSVLVPFWLYKTLGDQPLARISFGVSFMFFAALQIHLSHGFTEVHFGIFVLLAILIVFRDWWVIAVAASVIAVHHLLFMYLQSSGAPNREYRI